MRGNNTTGLLSRLVTGFIVTGEGRSGEGPSPGTAKGPFDWYSDVVKCVIEYCAYFEMKLDRGRYDKVYLFYISISVAASVCHLCSHICL